jgi:N-acetylmuramoyl-L-alanine amidase
VLLRERRPGAQPRSRTAAKFSAILVPVRGRILSDFLITLVSVMGIALAAPPQATQQPPLATSAPQTPAAKQPSQQQGAPAQQVPPQLPAAPPQPVRPSLNVVVLDPAHGGADAGARGPSGVLESEIVLNFARALSGELERQGLRVILTRQGNDNPSFDDRSATINALRSAIFITIHLSSSGPVGAARVYSLPLPSAPGAAPGGQSASEHSGLIPWDHAQDSYLAQSRRLAELLQIQLAQRFRGSPEVPVFAAVRQLRTIAAPAIAIEISSVSVPNAEPLNQLAPALAQAVARGVADFRPVYEGGAR